MSGKLVQSRDKKSATSLKEAVLRVSAFLRLRHRHVLTRSGRVRFRYVAIPAFTAFCFVSGLLASSLQGHTRAEARGMPHSALLAGKNPGQVNVRQDLVSQETDDELEQLMRNYTTREKRLKRYVNTVSYQPEVADPAPQEREKVEEIKIGSGDTLAAVLAKAGLSDREAYFATKAITEYFDPRHIRPGQMVKLHYVSQGTGQDYSFSGMELGLDPLKSVKLSRLDGNDFKADLHEEQAETKLYAGATKIDVSLYGSAEKDGIPVPVIADTIRIYSWDVDFQRDIRHGDKMEVFYERLETRDGKPVKYGNILFARLSVNGRDIPVYRYETSDGTIDYFDPDGKSIRKTLMTTPVDGARISSGFGMRHHPVLGYSKMHKGMDFAAPTGTPIYAAGDGVIERANRNGSYGNYVRIRHNSTLKTAYAHMQKFGPGIHSGTHVKQGQVIGYIGTTGRSTGPHLHYEVMMNGAQVNPRSVKLPQGETLKGAELERFRQHMQEVDQRYGGFRDLEYANAQASQDPEALLR